MVDVVVMMGLDLVEEGLREEDVDLLYLIEKEI